MKWFLLSLGAIELYYWCWWFPRNWRTNRECVEFVEGMKAIKRLPFEAEGPTT